MKLNQRLAVSKQTKADALRALTDAHRDVQKLPLLTGVSRVYQPYDDEGEKLPSESTQVQLTADRVIADVRGSLGRLFDVVAICDWANCHARADVVVDDQVVLTEVPVTYLLFLEKQLTDLHTFVSKLPVLDPTEPWQYSTAAACYVSQPVQTVRTKKVPRNHVKAEATDKHPAQVEVYQEDIGVGRWTTTRFSGALPALQQQAMLERVRKLREAVKYAREAANTIDAPDVAAGDAILGYLFG
jgi:hypothetical protein